MRPNFKVGDKVQAISPVDGLESLKGKVGIIIAVRPYFRVENPYEIAIDFGHTFYGCHTCHSILPKATGRYGYSKEFIKIGDENWDSEDNV